MKIFALENNKKNIKFLQDEFKQDELIIVDNIKDAITKFDDPEKYHLILLKHNLGLGIFNQPNDINSGSEFCRYLKEKDFRSKSIPIIIYERNRKCASYMLEYLQWSGYPNTCIMDLFYIPANIRNGYLAV